jgi:hypothetical protein
LQTFSPILFLPLLCKSFFALHGPYYLFLLLLPSDFGIPSKKSLPGHQGASPYVGENVEKKKTIIYDW